MRRAITIISAGAATAALVLTATGCGGSGGSSGPKGVGMAYDVGGRGDHSFNDSAAAGLDQAERQLHVKAKELTATNDETESDRETTLTDLARSGYNPVIAVGYAYAPAVTKVAKQFPKTTFGMVDSVINQKNVDSIVFTEEQSSYLAGVAAALTTKSGKVGFIGGVRSPLIQKFQAGFEQGVHDTKPSVAVTSQYLYTNDDRGFSDPAAAKSKAQGMLGNGIDVIYTAAGSSGNGSIEAVHAKKGAWAIGVDSDQYEDPGLKQYRSSILTSVLKHVNVGVFDLIKSVKDKKPLTGTHTYSLKENGVGLSYSGGFINGIKPKIEAAAKKIADGQITVRTTP